jgi:predicted RNase H-like HicB family nuclease
MGTLRDNELIFEVTEEADGRYVAECLTESIVTQGDTWEELRAMVKDAWMVIPLTDTRTSTHPHPLP